jgi:YbgC/YbaW family acyl-CoA thioester hydrolase
MMSRKPFSIPVTVEFEEVDSFGIAHHTKLVAYLERARVRLFAEAGLQLVPEGALPVLHGLEMRFRRPARLMDALTVSVAAEPCNGFRLSLRYEIRRGDELLARASTALAFWDPATDALVPVPAALLDRLEAWRARPDD